LTAVKKLGTILENHHQNTTKMDIQFDQVMPHPLASIQHGSDSIWSDSVMLKGGHKILLNASSGKGKSTFTMSVMGLRNDYNGTIRMDGRDIKQFSIDEWVAYRQNKLSVVFQDLQLFPNLSVAENLLLKNQLTEFKTENEIREFLDILEIGHKWNEPCRLLSMGQQQRVAIVRALCQPFEFLILDEPFSHLDDRNSTISLELIAKEASKQNAGFVLTSLDDDDTFPYDYELKL
jgi:ABC-type lipoprotein export system ATPase subunit